MEGERTHAQSHSNKRQNIMQLFFVQFHPLFQFYIKYANATNKCTNEHNCNKKHRNAQKYVSKVEFLNGTEKTNIFS